MTFGIVWSSREEEIAQTGYVYNTVEEAAIVGRKGLKWFIEKIGELQDEVGTQVDWTCDDAEANPIGFYVDNEDGFTQWHEDVECPNCEGNFLPCDNCGAVGVADLGGLIMNGETNVN